MKENTTKNFLLTAIECEIKAADTFMIISDMFSHVSDVSAMCYELYIDEISHIKMLEEIMSRMSEEELLQAVEREAWDFINASLRFMEKNLIDRISNLNDMYEVAHEIEDHEIMQAFKIYSLKSVPAQIRKSIIDNQIDQHMKKLDELEKTYPRERRERIRAQKK